MTIYETITNQIVNAIEKGQHGQFVMPWHSSNGIAITRPINVASKKPYNGSNVLMLWLASMDKGYESELWGTYKQWHELGAQVRKGEKATHIAFWTVLDGKAPEGETESEVKSFSMARAYFVFNAAQVDGFELPKIEKPVIANPMAPLPVVDSFVANSAAKVRTGEARAYYNTGMDYINMPARELFTGSPTSSPTECYYSTLLHELTHWTGHKSRLDREFKREKENYAAEELVAELGAAFLCADLGIASSARPDHAAYIASWVQWLKSDPKAIFTAASKAQKACNYLHELNQKNIAIAA